MSIRIDWQSIKSNIDGSPYEADEPFLFILPHAGRMLLLSVIQRLTWEASFRVAGYDYSDWDTLQAIVEEATQGLMETEQVNLIAAELSAINDTLQEIKDEIAAGDVGGNIDALTGVLTLLDPRLALLLEATNAVEDVLGGTWEIPEE